MSDPAPTTCSTTSGLIHELNSKVAVINQLRSEQTTFNTVVGEHTQTIDSLQITIANLKQKNKVLLRSLRASDRRIESGTLSEVALYGRTFGQEQHYSTTSTYSRQHHRNRSNGHVNQRHDDDVAGTTTTLLPPGAHSTATRPGNNEDLVSSVSSEASHCSSDDEHDFEDDSAEEEVGGKTSSSLGHGVADSNDAPLVSGISPIGKAGHRKGRTGAAARRRDEFRHRIQSTDPDVQRRLAVERVGDTLRPFEEAIRNHDEQMLGIIKEVVTTICTGVLLDAQHLVYTAAAGTTSSTSSPIIAGGAGAAMVINNLAGGSHSPGSPLIVGNLGNSVGSSSVLIMGTPRGVGGTPTPAPTSGVDAVPFGASLDDPTTTHNNSTSPIRNNNVDVEDTQDQHSASQRPDRSPSSLQGGVGVPLSSLRRTNSASALSISTPGKVLSGTTSVSGPNINNSSTNPIKLSRYHLRQKIVLSIEKRMQSLEIPSVMDMLMGQQHLHPQQHSLVDTGHVNDDAFASVPHRSHQHPDGVNNEYHGSDSHVIATNNNNSPTSQGHLQPHPSSTTGQHAHPHTMQSSLTVYDRLKEVYEAKDIELRRALLDKHRNVHLLSTLAHSYSAVRDTLQGQHSQWREDTRRVIEHAFKLGEKRGVDIGKQQARRQLVRGGGGSDDDDDEGGGGDGKSFWKQADDTLLGAIGADNDEELWTAMKEGLLDAFSVEPATGWGEWRSRKRRTKDPEADRLNALEKRLEDRTRLSEAIALFASEGLESTTRALRQQLKRKYLIYKIHSMQVAMVQQTEFIASTLKRNVVLERHLQAYALKEAQRWATGGSGGSSGGAPVPITATTSDVGKGVDDGGTDKDASPPHPLSPRRAHFTQFIKLPSNTTTIAQPVTTDSTVPTPGSLAMPVSSVPLSLTTHLEVAKESPTQPQPPPHSSYLPLPTFVDEEGVDGGSSYGSSATSDGREGRSTTTAPGAGGSQNTYPSLVGGVPDKYLETDPPVQPRHVEEWRSVPSQLGPIPTPHLDPSPSKKVARVKPVLTSTSSPQSSSSRPKTGGGGGGVSFSSAAALNHVPLDAIDTAPEDGDEHEEEGAIIPTTASQILYTFGRDDVLTASANPRTTNKHHPSAKAVIKAQVAELTSHVSLIRELERSAVHGDSGAYRNYLSNVMTESLFGQQQQHQSTQHQQRGSTPNRTNNNNNNSSSSYGSAPRIGTNSLVNKTSRRSTPTYRSSGGGIPTVLDGIPGGGGGASGGGRHLRSYTPLSARFEDSTMSLGGGSHQNHNTNNNNNNTNTPSRRRMSSAPRGQSPSTSHTTPRRNNPQQQQHSSHAPMGGGGNRASGAYQPPRFTTPTPAGRDDALIEMSGDI